jgi:hypothetical protein
MLKHNKRAIFGFSKVFVIILGLAALIGFATKSFNNSLVIIIVYVVIKIIWNLLT